jgi:Arc/MetJ-type ribon-helix-helix transcriptional regulator
MEPITLRLPTELLEELDAESDEAGFSTRSEYIRHLLFHRPDVSQIATAEGTSATTDSTPVDEIEQTVDELADYHDELTQRVSDLEEEVEQLHLNDDQLTDSSRSVSTTSDDPPSDHHPSTTGQPSADEPRSLTKFKQWLDENGPQSDDARTVLLDAAQILDDQGPLKASELREQLYERNPDTYGSAGALWASTVERLYDDLPGFERPQYGTYTFDREAAMESLPDPSD